MSNIEREVHLKRIARDVFQVKKLKNVPINVGVGDSFLLSSWQYSIEDLYCQAWKKIVYNMET